VLFTLMQTALSPHSASEVHSAPSKLSLEFAPPPVVLDPARPTVVRPPVPATPPPEMTLPPALPPFVPSSPLPQLAVAATVPTEMMNSVNQVRALTTEAS
jgi:hypothetical protein